MITYSKEIPLFEVSDEYQVNESDSSFIKEILYDDYHQVLGVKLANAHYYVIHHIDKACFIAFINAKDKDQYLIDIVKQMDVIETINLDITYYEDGIYQFDDFFDE